MKVKTKKSTKGRKVSTTKVGVFKAGTFGETTDYKVFKSIIDNRGIEGGIEETRVLKHMNDMVNGNYIDMGIDAVINTMGGLGDGTHRVEAKRRLGLPIRYYVTTDKQLNSKNSGERFIRISYLNSHSSQWSKGGTYKGSLSQSLPLAMTIKNLIDVVSANTGMFTKNIKVSWMFSIIKKDVKYFNSSKELNTAEVYNNLDLVAYTQTADFKNDFKIFNELVSIFNGKYKRFNNITRYILKLHWEHSEFNIEKMVKNLKRYRFLLEDNGNANDIKAAIQEIYNKKVGYKNYTKLYNL